MDNDCEQQQLTTLEWGNAQSWFRIAKSSTRPY